ESQFLTHVEKGLLPDSNIRVNPSLGFSSEDWIDLFETQVMTRALDLHARELRAENKSFYTIGSAGHEGNAAFGKVFRKDDPAFLHYRSGAFLIQRMKAAPGETPLFDLLLSFVASADDPVSGG